jgi:predicted phage-related endonuclease
MTATDRVIITPESEAAWLALRTQDITSTDVPALFGMSPYLTAFELWHAKRDGGVQQFDPSDRMLWGTRLQDAIAAGIAEDTGLVVRRMDEYIRLPGLRGGSSFDFEIVGANPSSPHFDTFNRLGPGILEIKNVDWLAFRNGWTIDADQVEAPAHIELQLQHQTMIAGHAWGIIAPLIGGNRYETLLRHADAETHAAIRSSITEFWRLVDIGIAPDPVMPDDADAVIRLCQHAEPGRLLDARNDARIASLVEEYDALGRDVRALEEDRKVRKAELLQLIGEAEKVLLDGYSISAGITAPSLGKLVTPDMVGTYVGGREGFRALRVTKKKAK